jgi:hypothetical protein
MFGAAIELNVGGVEEHLVERELGLRGVDLDDGGDLEPWREEAAAGELGEERGFEALGGEVELLGAALGVKVEAGQQGVEDAEGVAAVGALVGPVVDQADVALQAERDGVVQRERERRVLGLLDGYTSGAGRGGRRGEDEGVAGGLRELLILCGEERAGSGRQRLRRGRRSAAASRF